MFGQLVLARIIEPTSKLDSLRVLEEAGVAPLVTSLGQSARRGRPVSRLTAGGLTVEQEP
ncbi:hypothetical protein [Trebonia kvetii]|uniref:hypothetical protein n=1 Tax=Trebonia kvetii TaxID=2480626 RepID=UPI001652901A|nr:hypothetical protein [Trebonia kvetii]